MPGVLVISHGRFAEELVNATRTIVGDVPDLEAVSIGWDDSPGEASRRIDEGIRRVDRGKGVLLLTDMFGGTPSNLALSFLVRDRIEVVTGVNLPMLIKLTNLREQLDLNGIATQIAEEGREAIQVPTAILEQRHADPAEPEGGESS